MRSQEPALEYIQRFANAGKRYSIALDLGARDSECLCLRAQKLALNVRAGNGEEGYLPAEIDGKWPGAQAR